MGTDSRTRLVATGHRKGRREGLRERILAAAAGLGRPGQEELAERMAGFVEAADLYGRLEGWGRLVEWSRREEGRLELAMTVLEADPSVGALFQETVAQALAEADATSLFSQAGMPASHGFLQELGRRAMEKALPLPRDVRDLGRLLRVLYRRPETAEAFLRQPEEQFRHGALRLLQGCSPELRARCAEQMADGFRLLAARVQAQGLVPELRERSRPGGVADSPFYALGRRSEEVAAAWLAGGDVAAVAADWRLDAAGCREEAARIHQRLAGEGLSLDLVFGLAVIDRALHRMEAMVAVMEARTAEEWAEALHVLFRRLVAATRADGSLGQLVDWNLQLLHRRIVERSGETGEHYVASDGREYGHIWLGAAGGGLLTTLTAAVKLKILSTHLPLFLEGLAASVNYAASFVAMQCFGFLLATKQPAMTAAAMATLIRSDPTRGSTERIVDFTARLCSSQVAAAVSNVAVVSLGALAFAHLWQQAFGAPYMDAAVARRVLASLDPTSGGTAFYAALTGVLLWLGSVAGGWLENFAVYHDIPRGIAEHPLGRWLGRERMERVAAAVRRNVAGWGTNVSLGFLLGMTPVLGAFLGLPLDVRHVTLSTGMLTVSAATLGLGWWEEEPWHALLGVASMFVLNLGVSFSLSLLSASRAYGFRWADLAHVGWRIAVRLVRRPGDFLLPPRGNRGAAAGSHPA